MLSFEFDVDWLIPFAAGNFLYSCASDLVPEVKEQTRLLENSANFLLFATSLVFMLLLKLALHPWPTYSGTGRAFFPLPIIVEQQVEVVVAPPGGMRCPGTFDTTGDSVPTAAYDLRVMPAQSLLGQAGSLGFGPHCVHRRYDWCRLYATPCES